MSYKLTPPPPWEFYTHLSSVWG